MPLDEGGLAVGFEPDLAPLPVVGVVADDRGDEQALTDLGGLHAKITR